MQAFHPGTGMMLEFPDNTPAEDIDRHFQNAQANMPINAPSVAQQFLDGARGAYEQQQLAPAPVNGAGFVGLDPQQAQFMLQQRQNQAAMQQQSASEQARNRIEQQKMTQQSLESAADRAQTLKLRKQELQNLVAAKKIEADADKFEADLAAKGKELDRESRLKLEEMRQAAADRRAGDKLYNLNGQLVDGSGNVIADNTRQPAPPAPPTPKLIDTVDENGKPVQKWVLPEAGATYPSQPDTQSTAGQITEKDWFRDGSKILEEGMAADLEIMRQSNPEATIQPMEWKAINEPRYRQNMGLPPFRNTAAEEAFKKSAADSAFRNTMASRDTSGLTGEGIKQFRKQAEDAAQYEANKLKMSDEQASEILKLQQEYRAKGVELTLKFDPDGTPFLEEPE